MKKTKSNISLLALGDIKKCGLILGIKKGICELFHRKNKISKKFSMPKDSGEIDLSIILCTTGKCKELSNCINALLNQTFDNYEILVILNGDDKLQVDSFPDNIRFISEPKIGLSFARNTGAKNARGKILLYIDDDAIADINLAKIMVDAFSKHKDTAIIGGQIFLNVPKSAEDIILRGHESLWSEYRVSYKKFRNINEQYAFPYGACFGIRHSVLDALGGFPVNYGRVLNNYAGGEETAICFMAKKNGWRIGIEPKAFVEHRVDKKRFTKEHIKNTIRAGILTNFRLCKEGFSTYDWDDKYIKHRILIANEELKRLENSGTSLEIFYKECERDAFLELL